MTSGIIRRGRVFQTFALALVFFFQPSESQIIFHDDIFDDDFTGLGPGIPLPSPPAPAPPPNPPPTQLLDPIGLPGVKPPKTSVILEEGGEDPPFLPSRCESFSMSEFDRDYKTDGINSHQNMWALHGLQWKAYVHETVAGGSFNEGLISQAELDSQAYPLTVASESCNVRANFLNDLESRPNVYTSNTGAPVDPNGSWTCVDESDLSSENPSLEGAIIAALNMHFWKTPTYVDTSGGGFCYAVAPAQCSIEQMHATKAVIGKVTLCTKHDDPNTPPPPPPSTVCGWNSASWSNLIDISDDCENNIDLYSVTFSFFSDFGEYFNQDLYTSSPAAWGLIYGPTSTVNNWASIYGSPSTLVFDPPAGTTNEDIQNLVEAAKKASGSRVRRK